MYPLLDSVSKGSERYIYLIDGVWWCMMVYDVEGGNSSN